MLDWIHYLAENGEYDENKRIFEDSSENYQCHVRDVFDWLYESTNDEHWLDCSSHSLRYSAAQWARRCGADLNLVKRVGRWVNLLILMEYLAEGEQDIAIDPETGIDDIQRIFVFDTCASGAHVAREFPDAE